MISAEVNQRNPSPKIFINALQKLQTEATKAVFVGDMVDLDVVGPKSVGVKTILINRTPWKGESSVKPDRVIRDLAELLEELDDC